MTPPTLILLAGMPGAGKTTLGLALSRALHIPMLDKDTFKATLLTMGIAEQVAAPTAYELFFAVARDLMLLQGQSVILDSPAIYPQILANAQRIAADANATLTVIFCYVAYAERQHRLATRIPRASHLTADVTSDAVAATWFDHLPPDTLRLDMARPVEVVLTEAVDHIKKMLPY